MLTKMYILLDFEALIFMYHIIRNLIYLLDLKLYSPSPVQIIIKIYLFILFMHSTLYLLKLLNIFSEANINLIYHKYLLVLHRSASICIFLN